MKRIAKFEKVSWKQFQKDYVDTYGEGKTIDMNEIREIYNNIELPVRATSGSAGYDFKSPINFKLKPGSTIKIPTGIKVEIDDGWVLKCYPRSGLGFKYKMRMANVVPIIDSDYFYSDNERHIFLKLSNEGEKDISINSGDKIIQGVFVPYGITYDDCVNKTRNGGVGSTGK